MRLTAKPVQQLNGHGSAVVSELCFPPKPWFLYHSTQKSLSFCLKGCITIWATFLRPHASNRGDLNVTSGLYPVLVDRWDLTLRKREIQRNHFVQAEAHCARDCAVCNVTDIASILLRHSLAQRRSTGATLFTSGTSQSVSDLNSAPQWTQHGAY